ncbi:MAG: thymidylate synthase (FAD) [Firmicutes bacterium HGW-Firmicutes-4]|jgi:thymidylate synthase (FAD)|nr:MAG: thymidylate synthase (FAD) [Firmicutes bacterium HGW-Firmicutes-4]
MQVKILEHTPNPEKLVAAAAKRCYSDVPTYEIMDNLTDEQIKKLLTKLVNMGHESPLEHASFTFGIDGVSRALSHQLVRHRIASYSQKSQRYVSEGNFDYVVPEVIKNSKSISLELFKSAMQESQEAYDVLVESLIFDGLSEKEAYENARYVLPNACTTSIVVTMNIRILLHFFSKRCCNRAQWEIREMANEMLSQCRQVAPILFKNAGAPCVSGECPEGSMSCQEGESCKGM